MTNSKGKTIINIDTDQGVITINDKQPILYLSLKFAMLVNLFNAYIQINSNSQLNFIWIPLGLLSLILLIFMSYKTTTKKTISIEDINRLKMTTILGRKSYSILLKNGKKRNLDLSKNSTDLINLKEFIKS